MILISIVMVFFSLSTLAQTITLVDPDTATQCQKLTITVTGENTNFHQGTDYVTLWHEDHEIRAINNTVHDSTTIEGEFFLSYADPIGAYDVVIDHWVWGGIIDSAGFTLLPVSSPPYLVQTTPGSAHIGDTVTFEIFGENTHFDENGITNNIDFVLENHGGFSPFSTTVINSNYIQCKCFLYDFLTTGYYKVKLHNELDGSLFKEDVIEVLADPNPAEIVSVVPDTGYQGSELTITVTGRNTTFQQGTSTLFLSMFGYSPIAPSDQIVLNDTVIQGDFTFDYSHPLGLYDVVVNENGYTNTLKEGGFRLLNGGDAPSLQSIEPQNAYQGTSVKFNIKAVNAHFGQPGNIPSVTLLNGYEELYCHDITVIDSVTLEANYVFSYTNSLGIYDLVVHAPLDGTLRLENGIELLESTSTASIVAVNPDTAMQGQSLTINVTGRDIIFMQGTSHLMLSQGNIIINPDTQTIVNDTVISGEFNFQTTLPDGFYDVNVDNGYSWPSVILTDGFNLKLFDFVEETNNTSWLNIYPNPAHDYLYIQCSHQTNEIFTIQILDIYGKLLLEDSLTTNESEKQLSIGKLSPGTYLLKVIHGRQQQTSQFLIN